MRQPAPDVTAYELSAARELLEAAGWRVGRVTQTRPPGAGPGLGAPAVVRQRPGSEGEVELVVVYPARTQQASS